MDFYPQADENGVYLAAGQLLTKLNPKSFAETELAYAEYGNTPIAGFHVNTDASTLITQDGSFALYGADARCLGTWTPDNAASFVRTAGGYAAEALWDAQKLLILKLGTRQDAQILSYDPGCEHSEDRMARRGCTTEIPGDRRASCRATTA